ncbi:MAG: polymer-forming cytoskeletal protein [Rhodobacteraceae bacterium]|nr:polymer-forming cytoskeletal protein [Paracoccaceae bacterium]
MFSKSKINDPTPKPAKSDERPAVGGAAAPAGGGSPLADRPATPVASQRKPAPSTLSSDLVISGNLKTTGDLQIEGMVDGDIRAHLLTVGEGATVKGEIVADDVVVNGRVVGRVRGLKVRLTSTARVEGDIIHKTIAIESGAHFEGSVQRQDDPLNAGAKAMPKPAASAAPAPRPEPPARRSESKDQ